MGASVVACACAGFIACVQCAKAADRPPAARAPAPAPDPAACAPTWAALSARLRGNIGLPHWAKANETLLTPIPKAFIEELLEARGAIVTTGGSSMHGISPDAVASFKHYLKRSPENIREWAAMVIDTAMPAIRKLAETGRLRKGELPQLEVFSPGAERGERFLKFPENAGPMKNQEHDVPAALREELARRAPELARYGVSEAQLRAARVAVHNDAFPVATNAFYTRVMGALGHELASDEEAYVFFIGTGTGSARLTGPAGGKPFVMRALEEGHLPLAKYPALYEKAPPGLDHVLVGSMIANTDRPITEFGALELENISGGGRFTNDGHRTHLGGASTVTLSYLLQPEAEIAPWIRARATGRATYAELHARFLRDLGFESDAQLRDQLARNPADARLIDRLKQPEALSGKDLLAAAKEGSPIARRMVGDNSYAQGLAAGVFALNTGSTGLPGVEVAARALTKPVPIFVRASDAAAAWTIDEHFARARDGILAARDALFRDPAWRARLGAAHASGAGNGSVPAPENVKFLIDRVAPDPTVHADFAHVDSYLRDTK